MKNNFKKLTTVLLVLVAVAFLAVSCSDGLSINEYLINSLKSIFITAEKTELSLSTPVASVDASDWTEAGLAAPSTIKYVGREGTVYESETAPTAPGKYKAIVTVDEKTVELDYEF